MEIYQLVYATMVAKYNSFSSAAEKLFITQPSLSMQIQKLELELGFPIFFRNKRVVRLTSAGEQFMKDAQKVIKEFDTLKKNALKINESLKRRIVFGTSSFSSVLVVRSINSFLKAFPQVDFKLVEASDINLIEMVRNNELNLAIVVMPLAPPYKDELVITQIHECHVCAAMMNSNKLAKREHIMLKDLVNEELIYASTGSIPSALISDNLKELGYLKNSALDIDSIAARIKLIRDGAISFGIDIQAVWGNEPDLALIPIKPGIDLLMALIYPASQDMTFIENSLIDIILADNHNK